MSDDLFGPVTFGGGARWTPMASATDPRDMQVQHAVIDVATVLRGTVLNMNLGQADSYIWAGEWELALDEMAAVIQQNPDQSSDLAETMLKRAQAILRGSRQDREQVQR